MKLRLLRFKVSNFRSIENSDWIDVAENSCLVGVNESGKSNLLVALWKINPASGEKIYPLDDFPRHLYSKYKSEGHEKDVFISADFQLDEVTAKHIAKELLCDEMQVKNVLVERRFDGVYYISFPYSKIEEYHTNKIIEIISNFKSSLKVNESYQKESDVFQKEMDSFLDSISPDISKQFLLEPDIEKIITSINHFLSNKFGKKVNLPDFFKSNLLTHVIKINESFKGKAINASEEIKQLILKKIPKFVYYSDYGNLNSEIYLPRVVEDFERDDLSESARAKSRTLKVLFKYVDLSPEEIYEYGNDAKVIIKKVNHQGSLISEEEQDLTEEEIKDWAEKKRERGILLSSAASELTKNFKNWWQQGNYIFTFNADGRFFRINVSDELRPEPIELEGRSRGLQWFFSFFLVFLVEAKGEHSNSILLLDEPGLSLHPLAQYDLSKFFRKLSIDNQLIYTSHSPFLVDMDNLSNVKAVYVNSDTGRTQVSENLRYNSVDASKSIYPVHAALGLTISDTLLLGCTPVLVEGISDQIYLTAIKRHLIGKGHLKDVRELVFIPTGGIKGMKPITTLVSSRANDLPHVLLDSDKAGKEFVRILHSGRYKQSKEKVLEVGHFLGEGAWEIEDIFPSDIIIKIIDRRYRGSNYFEDSYEEGIPIVDQIATWAGENLVDLGNGWKVEIAKELINNIERYMKNVSEEIEKRWIELFNKFLS